MACAHACLWQVAGIWKMHLFIWQILLSHLCLTFFFLLCLPEMLLFLYSPASARSQLQCFTCFICNKLTKRGIEGKTPLVGHLSSFLMQYFSVDYNKEWKVAPKRMLFSSDSLSHFSCCQHSFHLYFISCTIWK